MPACRSEGDWTMRLQSAIFDMDGTLVDSMPMWRSRAESLVRSHGAVPPPDLNSRVNSLSVLEGAALCKELCCTMRTARRGLCAEMAYVVWQNMYMNTESP